MILRRQLKILQETYINFAVRGEILGNGTLGQFRVHAVQTRKTKYSDKASYLAMAMNSAGAPRSFYDFLQPVPELRMILDEKRVQQ